MDPATISHLCHLRRWGEVNAAVLAGYDVNARDSLGLTILRFIATRGEALDTLHLVLARGADPNELNGLNQTPLHHAVGSGFVPGVQALLAAGADVNAVDFLGMTPLVMAAMQGRVDRAEPLLACPALDLDLVYSGRTALQWAVAGGHTDLAALIAHTESGRRWTELRASWAGAVIRGRRARLLSLANPGAQVQAPNAGAAGATGAKARSKRSRMK